MSRKALAPNLIALALLCALAFGTWQLSRSTTFQLFGTIIDRVETDRPLLALTFDDGPDAAHTQSILDILVKKRVTATFFLNGQAIDAHPAQATAIAAAGHEIGNHGYTHARLLLRSPRFIRSEIAETDRAIRGTGYSGPIHVRPPYGKKLVVLPFILSQTDRTTVMWSLTAPEGPDATAQAITKAILDQAHPGAIIPLHPMFRANQATRAALPQIIDGLRAQGFEFVPLSGLLAQASDQ